MSKDTPQSVLPKFASHVLKWGLRLTIGFLTVTLVLLVVGVSLIVWHPQSANTTLPYIEKFTDGQLQIDSAEGRLADGLRLKNIRFNTPTVNLHIEQLEWQWRLSALLSRHIDFQEINITKPTLKFIDSDTEAQAKPTPAEPFAFLTQLNDYQILLNVDQLKITQATLQFNAEPAIEIAQLHTAIHWQELTLKLQNLSTDYQAYQLQANSRFEVLNATEFKADFDLNLSGLQGVESLKVITQASGGLEQIHFTLEMIEPYTMHSEHLLKIDNSLIQLDSQITQLTAKLNEQWQINQLQGHNNLRFDLNDKLIVNQGNLKIELKDKPLTNVNYSVEYAPSGVATFDLKTEFNKMGSVKAHGQANIQNLEKLTAKATVETDQLNLQWLETNLNYPINSLFDFTLSDLQTLTSQLDIKQFEITGLPEPFSFKGIVKTQHNNQAKTLASASPQSNGTDYSISIQSGHLNYAAYSGNLQAQLFIKPDLSRVTIPTAKLSLGDNSIDLSGQWAETLTLSVNANLNQLNQLYAPLSGKITAKVDANGRLLKDLSGFDQAWSTLQIDAKNLRYQQPGSENQAVLTLKKMALNTKIPLHKPQWSTFTVTAEELVQSSNNAVSRTLFSHLLASRQASKTGLASAVTAQHPELSLHAELYEAEPSLKQTTIALRRFDIKQPETGNWQLSQPRQIEWHSPLQLNSEQFCLQSVDNTQAKFCLQAQNNQANWSINELPIFDWIKPWLSDNLLLKGRLSGEGSANWKNALTLQQTLLIPQLDVTVIEQGYKIPFVVKNWQSELQMDSKKAHLKSRAQINETGRLKADIYAENKSDQTWSNAKLNGKVHLNLIEWPLKGRILELVKLNRTQLEIESVLSGTLNKVGHDTKANIDLNLDLPLLGLKNQTLNLQAQLTPQAIDAKGLWQQHENQANERQANLTIKLSQLKSQPKLLAHFDTPSIELLKTPFAHLTTSADMTVTMAQGATHIIGQVELQNSALNLDEMPLHQRTTTSGDEIIIDKQGQVVPKEESVSNLSYDIKIGFGENVKVEVQDSVLFLGGELQLVQVANTPDIKAFGEVKLRDGYINLDARNQIQIDQSTFLFNGMIGNPTLNVNLYRVVDQTTARLNITGKASQPQFVFYSTPALSQGRIINLMVFGRAGDMSTEPNYESQVLSAFYKLGIQKNTPVLNTLASTLGIQDVYFDVQGQQVSSLLVGRSLTDKLYVRYAKDLTGQQNNAVQFFYQLTKKWLLKTNSGDNNSSVDLIYRLER